MTIHVAAYSLFLVSLVYYYAEFVRMLQQGMLDEKKFGIAINIRVLFASLSQICLSYVFWHINKMSGGGQTSSEVSSSHNATTSHFSAISDYRNDSVADTLEEITTESHNS